MFRKFAMLSIMFTVFVAETAWAQFVSREAEMQARGSVFDEPEPEPVVPAKPHPRPYTPEAAFKIALIINGEMVTVEDINNRLRAFSFNTQIPLNEETKAMMRERVLQNTIDEKVKMQEAAKENIVISEAEIDEAIENFTQSNNTTMDDFYSDLKRENISFEVFREQIKSDLAWLRLVRKKTAGDIEPSQKEISRTIEQVKKDAASERYMVSEIVIGKKSAKNLNDLVYNLRNDPRFVLYAMQFSEAPSSSRGGSLGWISKGKLYPQLEKALAKMKEGDISDPIEIGDDYYIIKLERKYNPATDKAKIPTEQEAKSMIEGRRLEEFATVYLNKLRRKSIIEIKDRP